MLIKSIQFYLPGDPSVGIFGQSFELTGVDSVRVFDSNTYGAPEQVADEIILAARAFAKVLFEGEPVDVWLEMEDGTRRG